MGTSWPPPPARPGAGSTLGPGPARQRTLPGPQRAGPGTAGRRRDGSRPGRKGVLNSNVLLITMHDNKRGFSDTRTVDKKHSVTVHNCKT